jgi:hypothetical protein
MTDPTLFDIFGTDEPPLAVRTLTAGPMSVEVEGGQLRYLRFHGVEVLRGIAWIVRDASWGTLPAVLTDEVLEADQQAFRLHYVVRISGLSGVLAARAMIEGQASGHLRFGVTAVAETDVVTNRTGFVVLHPDRVAGLPVTMIHDDGRRVQTRFPDRIAPGAPGLDLAGLIHDPAPGLTTHVAFSGGVFEMEDQRNWADASFKTFVRPLRLPKPYVFLAGTEDTQVVTVTLAGNQSDAPQHKPASDRPAIGTMPGLWLRLDPGELVPDTLSHPARGLILRTEAAVPDRERLQAAAVLASTQGLHLGVEAVFDQVDRKAEAAALVAALSGIVVDRLLLVARRDFKSRPAGDLPAGEAPLSDTMAELRHLGFQGLVGGGTPAFFTEFNRNPPPVGVDFVQFGGAAIVHAADDRSVMETTSVLPAILDSAQALCPGVPMMPGPLAIAPSVSPYAPAFVPGDGARRVCMARIDPRHAALFGAAHFVGVMARLVGRVSDAAPLFWSGPSGIVDTRDRLLPIGFVHDVFASAAGCGVRGSGCVDGIARIEWDGKDGPEVMIANLTAKSRDLQAEADIRHTSVLAPRNIGWIDIPRGEHKIGAYRVVWMRGG